MKFSFFSYDKSNFDAHRVGRIVATDVTIGTVLQLMTNQQHDQV